MTDKVSVATTSWNRFNITHLGVVANLLGQSHQFSYQDCEVKISLPPNTEKEYGKTIEPFARRGLGKRVKPVSFWVNNVDLEIQLPTPLIAPKAILGKPPNQCDLLSEQEQKRFDGIATRYGELAMAAFDTWVRTLRWQTNQGFIGRDIIQGHEFGWATYLKDATTGGRFWASPQTLTLSAIGVITVKQWRKIQQTLSKNLEPPVFYDLFFDGIESMNNGDLRRAVIDFAVACESFIRILVRNSMPTKRYPTIETYIDEVATIRQIMGKFVLPLLTEEQKKTWNRIKPRLQQLFDVRNDLVHKGITEDLTLKTCEAYRSVTQEVLGFRSNTFGSRPR